MSLTRFLHQMLARSGPLFASEIGKSEPQMFIYLCWQENSSCQCLLFIEERALMPNQNLWAIQVRDVILAWLT